MLESRRLEGGIDLFTETPHRPNPFQVLPKNFQHPRLTLISERKRLHGILDDAVITSSATWISGPSGAGKTSLITSYVNARNLQTVWWRLDRNDRSPEGFLENLKRLGASHGVVSAYRLEETPLHSSALESEARDLFRNLFAMFAEAFALVLDDCHQADLSSPIGNFLRIACEEMPRHGHVYFLGRISPPPCVARLQISGVLSRVTASELRVTSEELPVVLAEHGIRPELHLRHEKLILEIGGWAAGVRIVRDLSMVPGASDSEANSICEAYFSHEIFDPLSAERQDFLMQAALLPIMTEEWIGCADPGRGHTVCRLLHLSLSEQHFIEGCGSDGQRFRFHPLFRRFLLAQASRRWSKNRFRLEAVRAVRRLAAFGELKQALSICLTYDLIDDAIAFLREIAPCLLRGRQLPELAGLLAPVSPAVLDGSGWLQYWLASSLALEDAERSLDAYSKAYARFCEENDRQGVALAVSGAIETIILHECEMTALDVWIGVYEKRLRFEMAELEGDIKIRLFCSVFLALCYRQPGHADLPAYAVQLACWRNAAGHKGPAGPLLQSCLAVYAIVSGDHAKAEIMMASMSRVLPAGPEASSWSSAVLRRAKGLFALHTGRDLDIGFLTTDCGIGSRPDATVQSDAMLLCYQAAVNMNRGDLQQAETLLGRFEQLVNTPGRGREETYIVLSAWRKYYLNEHAHALKLVDHSYHAVLAQGSPYFMSMHLLGLGLLSHLCGDTTFGLRLLIKGRDIGGSLNNPLLAFIYHLFSAHIEFDLGQQTKAQQFLANGMRIGRLNGYLYFPYFPKSIVAQLCLQAMESGIEPLYVQTIIERNKLTADRNWTDAEAWPWPLRIYTLGRFSVVKQGKPINPHGKAQKKPIELLKAIIAFGGRNVSESKLEDALWPEAEGDAACQALATTLFRLRKLIGEDAVHRQNGKLTIDSSVCWVDCWAFERVSNESTTARYLRIGRLRRLYQGHFLDDEESAAWSAPMRERLKGKYLRLTQ